MTYREIAVTAVRAMRLRFLDSIPVENVPQASATFIGRRRRLVGTNESPVAI